MAIMKRSIEQSVSPPPVKRKKLEETSSTDPHRMTVYAWNVNGIESLLQPAITSFFRAPHHGSSSQTANTSLRAVLRRYSWPTLLLLQEVKISPHDTSTRRAVERAVLSCPDAEEPSYHVVFCLPKDKQNARGFSRKKIYGVCTIIRQDFYDTFVDKVRECDWDVEGRVLICETRAVGTVPKLAIINLYAVNGTELPYKDPASGQVAGTMHDRKLQVHAALQAECRELEFNGYQVILAGDMNIARCSLDGHPTLREYPRQHCINRADFEGRFFGGTPATVHEDARDPGLNMVDSFRHIRPQAKGYTYYPRTRDEPFGTSCDRVDMVLLSQSLKMNLTAAGMYVIRPQITSLPKNVLRPHHDFLWLGILRQFPDD